MSGKRGEERPAEPSPDIRPPRVAEGLATDEELLMRFYETRDPTVREELVNRYMQFARGMALRYRSGNEPTEDLIQVASLGLVNAIERFDPTRGIPFLGFAAPTVLGELRRHFRDRVWNLRLPRGLQERVSKMDETITKLTGRFERPPTIHEIAEAMGVTDEEVLEAFAGASARRTASLDAPIGSSEPDQSRLGDTVGTEEEGYDRVEAWATIAEALPTLSERERVVLRLRFVEDLTQSQIAEQIGHSQMHVSRILRGALARLREELGEEPEPPAS
jgi:RNA polymerase sigma-B factor